MGVELQSIENNHTRAVTLPSCKTPVNCKWVNETKYHQDGTIDRHKAHSVAKCYTQQESVDFLDIFSPVIKFVAVKLLLSLVAMNN